MIKEIRNILKTYKEQKQKLDQSWTDQEAAMKAEYSAEKIERVRPELMQRHLERENTLKASTLAAIKKKLLKAEQHIAFMIQDIHPETLADIEAINGMDLSDTEAGALLDRYNGDTWATKKLIDMLNVSRDDMHKIQFTRPEELLQTVAEIKRDAAFILNNYTMNGETTLGQDKANIQISLIEKNFGDYADKLTTSYISEPDFDRPAPLTKVEERTVENFFAGCESSYSKREKAAELVEQGKGDLISRSEYAKYLPGGWDLAPELSTMGEMLLTGTINPEQYAGFAEVYQVVKPGETIDLLSATGVGAPEETSEAAQGTK